MIMNKYFRSLGSMFKTFLCLNMFKTFLHFAVRGQLKHVQLGGVTVDLAEGGGLRSV